MHATKTMTKRELIDALEATDYPDDGPVRFVYPSGDYWNTQLASNIADVEVGQTSYSQYHNMESVIDTEAEKELDEDLSEIVDLPKASLCILLK